MRVTGRGGMRWVKWVKWVERLAGPRDRLGEGLGDRLGEGLGEGLGDRLGEGLGDRLGEGLGDRLGERRETRRATGPSVPGQASAHGLSLARGAPVR